MSERTDETDDDAPREALGDTQASSATDPTGADGSDGAISSAGRAPDPDDEQLARAAAEAGPYSTLAPPPVRRPSRVGRVIWLGIAAAAVVLGIVFGPGFAKRVGELRTQRAAAEYAPPGTLVVYDEQPETAARLFMMRGKYLAVPLQGGWSKGGPPVAGHVPAAWRELRRWAFPASPEPPGALLFLHERQTAVGVRGIVAVEADRAARRLRVSFIHPGTYTSGPVVVADGRVKPPPEEGMIVLSSGRDPFESKLPPADDPTARADLRFFAGRPDAQDWTHFVIPYESDGYAGELEMWVADESTFHYVDRRFAKSG